MKINTQDTVSLEDAFAQIDARRRAENPWTTADESRYVAKSKLERERNEAWEIANPTVEEDEGNEDEGNTEATS